MEDIVQRPAPAIPPPSPDAVLTEQLDQCRKVVTACFEFCGHTNVSAVQQMEVFTVMSRLMRVSVALATALDKSPREFVHRVIVERPAPGNQSPMVDLTPSGNTVPARAITSLAAVDPPPPMKMSKTIHGGEASPRHNG